jgi:hypothetical protein
MLVSSYVAILTVVVSGWGSAHAAEAADCAKLQSLLTPTRSPASVRMKAEWTELESFHQDLWRAMALDPGIVSIDQVPDALQSKNLSEKLERKFEDLSNSVLIQKYGLEQPFAEYVDVVSQILALRREQKFINARAIAKKGLLDNAYHSLISALNDAQQSDEGMVLPMMSAETERKLKDVLSQMASNLTPPSVSSSKKADSAASVGSGAVADTTHPVAAVAQAESTNTASAPAKTSSPRYSLSALWAILGFLLGIPFGAVFYRAILADPSIIGIASGGAKAGHPAFEQFDFAQWLRGFRERVAHYRKLRSDSEGALRQVQPYLADATRLYRKYYQETRESHYRGKFTDLELATSELVNSLSVALTRSDEECRALIQHLSVLAVAIQTKNGEMNQSPDKTKAA